MESYGAEMTVERMMDGLAALPAPESPVNGRDCWSILGIRPTRDRDAIKAAFRRQSKGAHPDHGGTSEDFHSFAEARDQALAIVEAGRAMR